MHRAFNDFQIAADITPTGGIDPGLPTEKALIAALPGELERLKGVTGLAVAFAEGAGTARAVSFGRIPDPMLAAIEPMAKEIEDTLGLPLVPRDQPRSLAGRIELGIGIGYGVFLDGQGRAMPHDKTPDAVKAVVAKILKSEPRLELDPNAPPGRLVLSMQADAETARAVEQDLAHLHIDFALRDTMLMVIDLDEALQENAGSSLAEAVTAGKSAIDIAIELGFHDASNAKLIEQQRSKVLLFEIRRGTTLPEAIGKFFSGSPKTIALRIAETAGKTVKGSVLEIAVIGGLEIMKVVTETTEWEESVGNFVSSAAKAVVATAIAGVAVVLVGAVFPALVVTAAGVILVAALVGIAAGRTLDYADDGRLAKYVTAGIQYLQATDIELRGEPRNIYEIDDSQFWNLMVAARMRT